MRWDVTEPFCRIQRHVSAHCRVGKPAQPLQSKTRCAGATTIPIMIDRPAHRTPNMPRSERQPTAAAPATDAGGQGSQSVSRRSFLLSAGAAGVAAPVLAGNETATAADAASGAAGAAVSLELTVNQQRRSLSLDARTTLLDALRDHLQLTGSKKGCDHGQCGA